MDGHMHVKIHNYYMWLYLHIIYTITCLCICVYIIILKNSALQNAHFNFIPVRNSQDCIMLWNLWLTYTHYFSSRFALIKIYLWSPVPVWQRLLVWLLLAAILVSLQSPSRLAREGTANDLSSNIVPVAIDRLCSLEKIWAASWRWQFVN
jgi:hypothetical protein